MFYQKVRKAGNSYVVTIPKDQVDEMGLEQGDLVAVHLQRAEIRPVLDDDLREIIERLAKEHKEGLLYLAAR